MGRFHLVYWACTCVLVQMCIVHVYVCVSGVYLGRWGRKAAKRSRFVCFGRPRESWQKHLKRKNSFSFFSRGQRPVKLTPGGFYTPTFSPHSYLSRRSFTCKSTASKKTLPRRHEYIICHVFPEISTTEKKYFSIDKELKVRLFFFDERI